MINGSSLVKILIKSSGTKKESIPKIIPKLTESLRAKPKSVSMVYVSFFPQYCTVSIVRPLASPIRKINRMN